MVKFMLDALKEKSGTIIRILITIVALVLILAHHLYPELKIDNTTLWLFLLAILPWVAHLFKSIEIPGIGKVVMAKQEPESNPLSIDEIKSDFNGPITTVPNIFDDSIISVKVPEIKPTISPLFDNIVKVKSIPDSTPTFSPGGTFPQFIKIKKPIIIPEISAGNNSTPETTQPPQRKSEEPTHKLSPKGFYTDEGLSYLLRESGYLSANEKVIDHLLIFRTRKQHTWLITTNLYIYCILDDEKTRAKDRLVQWRLRLEEAFPVRAKLTSRGNHVVNIGPKRNWLYSASMFPMKSGLEGRISEMIENAMAVKS